MTSELGREMQTIAVAAISARAMAETAASDGFNVVALDLFGDADTRRAASRWLPIGTPGTLRIDTASTLAALRKLAAERESGEPVVGWIAGSGFEGEPGLLEQGAAVLPLIGTAPGAVRRLRDPAAFFGFLTARVIAYPQVLLEPPDDPTGWLIKDAHGCGGWHVRHAPRSVEEPLSSHHYFQREMPGVPMSATFIANGHEVQVLGFNEMTVRRFGARPFVFCGAVGPVPVPENIAMRVTGVARALTAEFELRGLCSLDFMRDGDAIGVLEVNPRPPASMSLYRRQEGAAGLMQAHLRACLHGELPAVLPPMQHVEGIEIVFARRPMQLDAAAARLLAQWPGIHDIPAAGQRFDIDDPLCTLTASGTGANEVRARLGEGRESLLQSLEILA
ncbi:MULTISPECIES: ATP-grasp domain-containing protein [Variovorax]|uniref:ATP-grasp domain-containing protein n=1 Tax=Variovorax TaxID=34072 RepID=UPI002866034C|nr:ATP-grasp domain-containing protein [Variovorax sp. 3319]MDR6889735.1 putative ATP-grasp superfamily ATP-dependent carboligase [Variovorax sp. 3319]